MGGGARGMGTSHIFPDMRILYLVISLFFLAPAFGLSQPVSKLLEDAGAMLDSSKYSDAIALYDRILSREPRNVTALRNRGLAFGRSGVVDRARADFISALALEPECTMCYLSLSKLALMEADFKGAVKFADDAVGWDAKSAEAYYLRGLARDALGRKIDALMDYNHAIQLAPKNPDYLIAKAKHYMGERAFDIAEEVVRSALVLDPERADTYFQLCRCQIETRRYEEALASITLAIGLDRGGTSYYSTRAGVHGLLGEYQAAVADCDTALTIDSSDVMGWANRAQFRYRLEDMDGSCEDYRRLLTLVRATGGRRELEKAVVANLEDHCDPSLPGYYYQRAIAMYNLGRFERAIQWYDDGLKRFPGDPIMIEFRGNARLASGRYREALADYERVLTNVDTLAALTRSRSNTDTYFSGTDSVVRAAIVADLRFAMAQAYAGLEAYDKADECIEAGLYACRGVHPPSEARLHYLRGMICLRDGRNGPALAAFDMSLEAFRDLPEAHLNKAIALLNLAQQERIKVLSFSAADSRTGQSVTIPLSVKRSGLDRERSRRAVEACDRAIELNARLGQAYLIRAYARLLLNEGDACSDLRIAQRLGMAQANQLLETYCPE